jgi:type II secretory pathway pseudopilin PulG
MRNKQAFLLLEVIIVLFVLSLIVIPWYGFIGAVQKDESIAKLDEFFLTKEVFIQAYKGEILEGRYSTQNKEFLIVTTEDILYVQLLDGTKIQQEIKGKKR